MFLPTRKPILGFKGAAPNLITAAKYWLNAADAAKFTGSAPFTAWSDEISAQSFTASTSGSSPSRASNAATFDGAATCVSGGNLSNITFTGAGQAAAIMIAFKPVAVNSALSHLISVGNGSNCFAIGWDTSNRLCGIRGSLLTTVAVNDVSSLTNGFGIIATLWYDGTNLTLRRNGVQSGQVANAYNMLSQVQSRVAADPTSAAPNHFSNISVYDAVWFDNTVTLAQLQSVETYLRYKNGFG